jgi:fucose permease
MGLMIQIVAVMCMFQFGVVISSLGALKLSIAKELNLDNRQVAGLISAMMLTSAVVVLLVGPLVDAFGHQPLAVVGLVTGAAGLSLLVSARSYGFALLACVILGVGGICACTVSSTLMPLVLFGGKNAPAASNLGNAFFGLGAFFTAMIIGLAQKGRGYRIAGHFLALVVLAVVVPALLADYPAVSSGFEFSQAIGLLGNAVVIVAALAFFMNTGVENTMGNWITSYGTSIGYSDRSANMLLSAFWVSIMVSRLATASLITPQTGAIVSAVLSVVVFAGLCAMWLTHSKPVACFVVLLVGAMLGPITPTVTGVMFSKLPANIFGSAFAIFFAVGLIGATSIPAGVGMVARRRPIRQALAIPMAAAILIGLFTLLLNSL